MFYLILKYTFLFALAALFGFLFGRWWARRSFIDVTNDYVAMSRAADAPWERVWQRLDALETSMGDVRSDLPAGLEVVQDNLAEGIKQGLSSVRSTLVDMEEQVGARPGTATHVDLTPLEQRLASLEEVLLHMSGPGSADLSALEAQISKLSVALAQRGTEDLAPVDRRLAGIERSLDTLQVPDLNRWLAVVEEALRANKQGPLTEEPIESRLAHMEQEIARLSAPGAAGQVKPKTAARARKPAHRIVSRQPAEGVSVHAASESDNLRLFESPRFGSKDDLKQISGIGPKIERELNSQGVYYFWQVAEWQGAEIRAMEQRLEAFRGRIERDGWVSQARRLMNNGNAATRPGD